MNTVINRFFSKSEPTSVTTTNVEDQKRSLIDFLATQGTKSGQFKELCKNAKAFVYPDNDFVAQLHLVQFYLKFEKHLILKDPRFLGTAEKLRKLISSKFPELTAKKAFLPLYVKDRDLDIIITRNYLKFIIYTFEEKNRSEKLASRWMGVLDYRLVYRPNMELVEQINFLRKLRESAQEQYEELVESLGNEWADPIIKKCYKEYRSFYQGEKSLKCIDELLPEGLERVSSIPKELKPPVQKLNGGSNTKHTSVIDSKSIFENILDAFVLLDKGAQILDFNSNALQILGCTKADIKQQSLLEYLPKDLATQLKHDLEKTDISIPNVVIGKRHETVLSNKGKIIGDFEITVTNNYTDQDTYSIFLKDITHKKDEIKSIEESKVNAERMAKAKTTFLSNMSHEIRTPLNVILGLSEIIKKRKDMDEALLKKNLEGIDFSAKSLLSIVNDILDFSKIEAGKLTTQAIDFNLRKVVTSLSNGFEIKAKEKGLQLTTHIDTSIPEVIVGDQYRINQILTNLIANAIKFTNSGGITITVGLETENTDEVGLHFKVEDTGIGIPKDDLGRIFSSFYQVESPESSKVTGTGLGLAITKELVQLQGGVLEASSVVGKGSVFEFTLPLKRSKLNQIGSADKQTERNDKNLEGLKVLVAEDNQMNQFYIKQLLNNLNVEVDIAENGKEAVDVYNESKDAYDLILMDMHMPIMNGVEAIKLIRESNKDAIKKVPIVACSADVFPEARKNAIKVGIDFYLTKPIDEEAVKEVLFWLISDDDAEPNIPQKKATSDQKSTNIDINQLQETFDHDEEFIISLLEVFIKETPDDYKSMRKCIDREFYARASSLAHKMKSSFMNLGMTAHGHHLQQIESNLIKRGGQDEAKKHLGLFDSLYTKALIEATILSIELKQN